MKGYIRNPKTWALVKTVDILSYQLPIQTDISEAGNVTFAGLVNGEYERFMFTLEGVEGFFAIGAKTSSYGDDNTTVNLFPWQKLFDGMQAWGSSLHNFSWLPFATVNSEQIQSSNPFYGLSAPDYIIRRYSSLPADIFSYLDQFQIPETVYTPVKTSWSQLTYYVHSIAMFLNEIQKLGVTYTFKHNRLEHLVIPPELKEVAEISVPALMFDKGTVYPIFFHDGHSELRSFSLENQGVSLVSCFATYEQPHDTYNTCQRTFALSASGTVEYDRNISSQASGEYVTLTKEYGYTTKNINVIYSELQQMAEDEFAKNTSAHKAEFVSDKRFYMGQRVRLVLDGFAFDTMINKVMLNSGDSRFVYSCGDLPNTMTETIRDNSWIYGRRLPINPRKGQLVFI